MGGSAVCVTTDLRTFGLIEDPYGDVRKDDGIHRNVAVDADGAQPAT